MRAMVDFGIDLGTTNSAIALYERGKPRLLPAADGSTLLPSAVWIPADGRAVVGSEARQRLNVDPENTALEFKRSMGTPDVRHFPASNRSLRAEELSAAVLTALLDRAALHGERPSAAVVTIPAMFQLPQCDATRRAAKLAGLAFAPLLQEPIAAAIAHGGTGELREGYWLVYDLGGGTFDVSLVRSKDGRLQVLDHDGDNHLGGRDLDRALIRRATERGRADGGLPDIPRGHPAHGALQAALKTEAERVRVALSTAETETFAVSADVDGRTRVEIRFELERAELEELVRPLIRRTTTLATKIIQRNRVTAADLRAVVLVGGPTRMPLVSSAIAADVGIEVQHLVDPMHVVAAGAALFASTQRLPLDVRAASPQRPDTVLLDLAYESLTTNTTPLVAGRLVRAPEGAARLSIRFVRGDGGEASPWKPIDAKGNFAVKLPLVKNTPNTFTIELRAENGALLEPNPRELRILHGFSVSKPPLSQSVGVLLADGSVCWYVRKGAVLPTSQRMVHSTTIALSRGQSGDAIKVPIAQGESARGDRNKIVGMLHIRAEAIARDLPVGSEVQVTMSVDESQHATARAYVPRLDQWFDEVMLFELEAKDASVVKRELSEHKSRLDELNALAAQLEQGEGGEIDERLKGIESLIDEGDRDAVDAADQLLRGVAQDIDVMATRDRAAMLDARFAKEAGTAESLMPDHGQPGERQQLTALTAEYRRARERGDLDLAEAKCDELEGLVLRILLRIPDFWKARFRWLVDQLKKTPGAGDVAALVAAGQSAIDRNAIEVLARICYELASKLPSDSSGVEAGPNVVSHVR